MSIAWLTLVLCFLTTFTTTISAFLSPQVPRIPKRIRPSNDSPRHRPPLSPLYGIKGFQAWFNTQFPDATIEIDLSSHESFDHVLVDMNQVLHVILRRSRSREHAIRLLMSELDRMVQLTTPTQSLVLAVDGPPAAAKLATQRRRRYGTLVRTQWKLTHFDKLRISKRSRTKRLRGYQSDLKSLEITPATQFMKSMEASLIYWAWQRLQQRYSKLQNVKIYINPSAVPGEGEIKLLEWIFEHGPFYSSTNTTTTTNNNNKKQQRGQSICFFGGDSDLLLEGLVIPPSFAHNVFVVRQEQTKKYLCISLWDDTDTGQDFKYKQQATDTASKDRSRLTHDYEWKRLFAKTQGIQRIFQHCIHLHEDSGQTQFGVGTSRYIGFSFGLLHFFFQSRCPILAARFVEYY
jgi:hypothetical protein